MLEFLKNLKNVFVTNLADTSTGGNLNQIDWAKLTRNCLLVAGAAVVTYLQPLVTNFDFGEYKVFVVPVVAFVFDAVVKFFKNHQPE